MLWQTPPSTLPPLKPSTIHLWLANLDTFICPTISVLSPDETSRAQRFKFTLHQNRFTTARTLLRHILAQYLQQTPQSLQFAYTNHGKPYLPHASIYFNLSHTNQWALYAVGLEEKLGVDIEHITADRAHQDIATRFFSDYENQLLKKIPAPERQAAFFKIWTCKEAFIKAIGEGLSFPLKNFDISINKDATQLISINQDEKEAKKWSCITFTPITEYIATLTVQAPIKKLKFWSMEEDK